MKTKKRKLKVLNVFVFILVIVSLSLGYVLYEKGTNTEKAKLSYQENGDVTYKVFLNENNFFETPYLDMNGVYITSLINYIDTNFNYSIVFDEPTTGNYTYVIKGLLSADTQNENSNYWTKEYQLSNPKTENFTSKNAISFSENVKVNYQKYNDLLMKFKQEYGLTMNGKLKVYLEAKIKTDGETIKETTLPEIEVPLTKSTIEVPIEIKKATSSGHLKNAEENKLKDKVYKYLGFLMFACGIFGIIYLVVAIVRGEKTYAYIREVNKITKTYDGIIVNVNELPKVENVSVIDVENFEELLDAHSEVRLPINYYDDEEEAIFILIGENMAWKYTIKKERKY